MGTRSFTISAVTIDGERLSVTGGHLMIREEPGLDWEFAGTAERSLIQILPKEPAEIVLEAAGGESFSGIGFVDWGMSPDADGPTPIQILHKEPAKIVLEAAGSESFSGTGFVDWGMSPDADGPTPIQIHGRGDLAGPTS